MAAEHLETLSTGRIGWIEGYLGRFVAGPFWEPGPLFVLLRAQRRRTFFMARWEFWLGWGYPLLILGACLLPPLWIAVVLAPMVSVFFVESTAASSSARLRHGMGRDLYLASTAFASMRADVLAFAASRSLMPFVATLILLVVLLLTLGNAMPIVVAQAGKDGGSLLKGLVHHGMIRGLGLGNGAGRAVLAFVGACTAAGVFVLMVASPVLLFVGTYLVTGLAVAGVVALILGIHGLILWIALRSRGPSPFGMVGEALGAVHDAILNPPAVCEEDIWEAMLGTTS